MDAVSTKHNSADATISLILQVPQGDRFKIEVKESQYNFYLNETIVKQIQQAKKNGGTLYIPPSLLIPLWYYTCVSHNVIPATAVSVTESWNAKNWEEGWKYRKILRRFYSEKVLRKGFPQIAYISSAKFPEHKEDKHKLPDFYYSTQSQPIFILNSIIIFNIFKLFLNRTFQNKIILQTEFTFNSYLLSNSANEEPVFQSSIFLNGDVFHKIRKDCLELNSQFSPVISAHYWLCEQILNYFRTNFSLLTWEVASLVPAGIFAHNLYPANWRFSIVTWLGATIVLATIRFGLFSQLQRRTAINFKYLDYLAWELTCLISAISVATTNGFQALLMMLLSPLIPPVLKRLLAFIWPQIGKLIMRQLLSRID